MPLRRLAGRRARFRRRWLHRAGWYRNDMRRTSDRWEIALTAVLLAALVVALPFAAWAVGRQVYQDDVRRQGWNSTHRLRVEAVLLADAVTPVAADGSGAVGNTTIAPARWTAPDGTVHEGTLQVVAGDRSGARVSVWADEHGTLVEAPAFVHPFGDAINAAVLVVLGGFVLLLASRVLLRALLHRRRLRTWQQEWLEVGPRWSRHR
jgi:hypothetical protein